MNKVQLPHLKKVLLKGLLTFARGVKIGENNININHEFKPVIIDKVHLDKYNNFFNYKSELPLTYLYLLAQRAQISLMLSKHFTISIPGLIHVSNELEKFQKIDLNSKINIKSNVSVKSKSEGSLNPVFKVEFYQNDILIASCISSYIAKRKSKSFKKNRERKKIIKSPSYQKEIQITKKDAAQYANLSGDNNPIHTYSIIAKLFGFKSTIIHGWYLASISFQEVDKEFQQNINKFSCNFLNVINLPTKISFVKRDKKHQIICGDKLCFEAKVNTFVKPHVEHSKNI